MSFGLFISAEYKRSQNPDNYNINTSTIGTYLRPNNRKCGHLFYFGWYSVVVHSGNLHLNMVLSKYQVLYLLFRNNHLSVRGQQHH